MTRKQELKMEIARWMVKKGYPYERINVQLRQLLGSGLSNSTLQDVRGEDSNKERLLEFLNDELKNADYKLQDLHLKRQELEIRIERNKMLLERVNHTIELENNRISSRK